MATKLEKMFLLANAEFLEFERIPEAERRHPRSDVCAFIYLHEKLGVRRGKYARGMCGDMVAAAEHDEIFLDYDASECKKLTQEDVTYLARCGVRLDNDSLCMFV